jgi:hypothetical protein
MQSQRLMILGFLLLVMPTGVQAQFYYTVTNGTVTITGYWATSGVVVIPDTITGLPVTAIGDTAFALDDNLTSLTIPNTVTSIGDHAFSDTSLTNVTIPNSVTNIGVGTFGGCPYLAAISVETNNPAYTSVSGVLFNQSQTTMIDYPGGKVGSYSIPNSVTSIGDYACNGCTGLTSLIIPNSVTSIGDYALNGCTGLTSLIIPNSVTSIGDYAFSSCTNLTSITIPNRVTSIGYMVYRGCTNKKEIDEETNKPG